MPSDAAKSHVSRFFYLRGVLRANMGDKAGRDPGPGNGGCRLAAGGQQAIEQLEDLYREAGDTAGLESPAGTHQTHQVAQSTRIVARRSVGRAALVLVFCLPAALCAAWTLFAGKDLNWDLLNYHYYLPFELLAGRLQQDFFAASAQSYLNPVGYLPFYLMVSSGWHSVIASVALAVAHSLSIALLYLIAWTLFAHLPPRAAHRPSLPRERAGRRDGVFWAMVGSSFLDPLLAPLILAGLLVLLDGKRRAPRRAGGGAVRRRRGAEILQRDLRRWRRFRSRSSCPALRAGRAGSLPAAISAARRWRSASWRARGSR